MKQKLLLLISVLLFQVFASAQGTEQMVFKNDFREVSGGLGNLTSMFMTDGWWSDANGDEASVIRVKVVDMSVSEMKKLNVRGSANLGIGKKQFFEKEQVWLIAVSAGNNMFLEMTHPTYGTSTRLNITQQLRSKTIYDVTLVNNKTTSISVNSTPVGADIYLDDDWKGKTPCEIPGQRFGHHTLKLLLNGQNLVKDIQVEEGHTTFNDFDFRERRRITITSDPDGAAIYVDGEMIGKAPIYNYDMVLGAHTFKAVYNASQMDEKSVNITSSSTTIDLHPIKKGNVHVTTKYGGRPVAANLVIDNEKNLNGKDAYDVTLPYGRHTLRVSYGSRIKEKDIRVSKPQSSHEFKLSAKNDIVWPWQREYEQRPYGFSIGYVQKQVVSKNGSQKYKFEPAYFREGKSLSGIQMGIHFQPTLSWGLGIYTGLFYELYLASCDDYGDEFKNFSEHSLNLPLHLYYRIPFANRYSLAVHGGLGFDLGLYACYSKNFLGDTDNDNGYSESYSDYYGESNGGPNAFNMTWDIALTLNLNKIAINAFMSTGLLNHKGLGEWDDGEGKNLINKLGVSMSFLF